MTTYQVVRLDEENVYSLPLWARTFEGACLELDRYNENKEGIKYYLACKLPERKRPYDVELPMFATDLSHIIK